ncbi:histidine--tRNA ligase [Rhodanobacter panaciterrae]|uniref:Histidine--tRNA ligase n=1 Tax=Rhodanobacter panaciterrae TaxID=490572 RepID=A0ABQ2ZT86_9GAMM|nr:histidine--tRNA ligase [Rhodanobacter panaciterrae]GGY22123.1 histidine--tRNA ligase [Rhodanobacter panaciterrae]
MALTPARTMPGVLELLPLDQIAFQRMLDVIRRNYERFGFLPIETPVIEYSDVLLTKTGGETERQVYFVQSTGALEKQHELVSEPKEGWVTTQYVPELALRFDLTVPLARYVAEHERDLSFPFRRYQMQKVYRGERAQRGRFREFYQCDIDVIGKDALSVRYDAEIPAVIYSVFRELNIGAFTIQLNNRKLMRGYFESLGIVDGEQQMLVLREVDKLDKRGADYVRDTLTGATFGLSAEVAQKILAFVQVRSTSLQDAYDKLDALGAGPEAMEQGRNELKEVLGLIHAFGVPETHYVLNLSIARGLDYYTGTVYETTLNDHPQIGSICSGGRYENLASQYTKSQLPGVGISIGLTRLYWQLRDAGLISTATSTVDVLVTQMDAAQLPAYLALASELRGAGIATEVVLEGGKLGKQFKYADRAGIRFVIVLGEDEIAKGVVTVKDLRREDQFEVARSELIKTLRVELEQAAAMG